MTSKTNRMLVLTAKKMKFFYILTLLPANRLQMYNIIQLLYAKAKFF